MSAAVRLVREGHAAEQARAEHRHAWWEHAEEVLGHVRAPFRPISPGELADGDTLALVTTTEQLGGAAAESLHRWTRAGGMLVVTGDPGELARPFGLEVAGTIDREHATFCDDAMWTQLPSVPLRTIGGVSLRAQDGDTVLATFSSGAAAILRRCVGEGTLIAVGADLWQSIVRIQQGYPVHEDGTPASDGTAPIDDDILKAEDGLALSLEEDRALPPGEREVPQDYAHVYPPPAAVPVFPEPHADHWRSALLQLLWWGAERTRTILPWLAYWPAGVPAIAHMSHDADQNDPADARAALDAFAEADVAVTWCQVHPGGYGPEIHEAITSAGHENALHFNAMGDSDLASWGWPQMRAQYAWAQAVTGQESIVSNKNHYTRWEGWTEFYTWCERLGIQIDESRGPSKQGSIGFPFGTAHVSFPMGDLDVENRPMDVLSLPLHTQDLAWASHVSVRDVILDGALAQHGVAHFLFHGPHLRHRPATRDSCPQLARRARELGMSWWTAGNINAWERSRRTVDIAVDVHEDGFVVRTASGASLDRAAVLIPIGEGEEAAHFTVEQGTSIDEVVRHGRRFLEIGVDLEAGEQSWSVRRR